MAEQKHESEFPVRLAILETRVDESFREHNQIFTQMAALTQKIDDYNKQANDRMVKLEKGVDRYATYCKFLWPIITVAATIIGYLLHGPL